MNCNIVKDLLPLYIDGCCCGESAEAVEEHLRGCETCRAAWETMRAEPETAPAPSAPDAIGRIRGFRASILQSALLFVSFAAITLGVALEAATPESSANGFWAFVLIVPATGFLLSLANWYFIRQYKSRKRFAFCSLLATLGVTLCGCLWAIRHYGVLSAGADLAQYWPGLLLTVLLCAVSWLLSDRYAAMIGKE